VHPSFALLWLQLGVRLRFGFGRSSVSATVSALGRGSWFRLRFHPRSP